MTVTYRATVSKAETRACRCGEPLSNATPTGTYRDGSRIFGYALNCGFCGSDSMMLPHDAPATIVRAARNADAMRVVGRWSCVDVTPNNAADIRENPYFSHNPTGA